MPVASRLHLSFSKVASGCAWLVSRTVIERPGSPNSFTLPWCEERLNIGHQQVVTAQSFKAGFGSPRTGFTVRRASFLMMTFLGLSHGPFCRTAAILSRHISRAQLPDQPFTTPATKSRLWPSEIAILPLKMDRQCGQPSVTSCPCECGQGTASMEL